MYAADTDEIATPCSSRFVTTELSTPYATSSGTSGGRNCSRATVRKAASTAGLVIFPSARSLATSSARSLAARSASGMPLGRDARTIKEALGNFHRRSGWTTRDDEDQ